MAATNRPAPTAPSGAVVAKAPPVGLTLVSADLHLSQPDVNGDGAALVHLPPVDVVGGETGTAECFLGRRARSPTARRAGRANRGVGHESRYRRQRQCIWHGPRRLSATQKPRHPRQPCSLPLQRRLQGTPVTGRPPPPATTRRPTASSIARTVFARPGSASM